MSRAKRTVRVLVALAVAGSIACTACEAGAQSGSALDPPWTAGERRGERKRAEPETQPSWAVIGVGAGVLAGTSGEA